MKLKLLLPLAALCLLWAACSNESDPSFSFSSSLYDDDGETITLDLYGELNATRTLTFSSAREWTASVDCTWLTLSDTSGDAGTAKLTLINADDNTTGSTRTATLTLTSSGLTQTIEITQDPALVLEEEEISVSAEGIDELYLYFWLNMSDVNNDLYIYYGPTTMFSTAKANANAYSPTSDFIQLSLDDCLLSTDASTRSAARYYIGPISVLANTSASSRSGYFYFYRGDPYEDTDYALLGTVTLTQEGDDSVEVETSTDYSADGTVLTLQTASIGTGIPIVLMGDGFIDTEITDGTYDTVMQTAMENLFTEEPMTALRDYFSVYEVQVVSECNVFGADGYSTALGCVMEGGTSTYIEGDDGTVYEYVQLVDGIDHANALVVVVLNTNDYGGTTFFRYTINKKVVELAIAYCPMIYSMDSETFRQVLVHEAVGHGFAKLADEYSYSGTISSGEITSVQNMQTTYGWQMNVDFTDDTSSVLWADFLSDDTYAGEELGVYEGGYTYAYGVYRPTYESMMNSNQTGFNAPSRQEIYFRLMEEYTGEEPSHEEFVAFDVSIGTAGKALTIAARAALSTRVDAKRPHPPVATDRELK